MILLPVKKLLSAGRILVEALPSDPSRSSSLMLETLTFLKTPSHIGDWTHDLPLHRRPLYKLRDSYTIAQPTYCITICYVINQKYLKHVIYILQLPGPSDGKANTSTTLRLLTDQQYIVNAIRIIPLSNIRQEVCLRLRAYVCQIETGKVYLWKYLGGFALG